MAAGGAIRCGRGQGPAPTPRLLEFARQQQRRGDLQPFEQHGVAQPQGECQGLLDQGRPLLQTGLPHARLPQERLEGAVVLVLG